LTKSCPTFTAPQTQPQMSNLFIKTPAQPFDPISSLNPVFLPKLKRVTKPIKRLA
jgi:hypothetical protein